MCIIAHLTDEWIERSYTPVLPLDSSCQDDGAEVKLMVKLYNNGAMSSILSSLQIGMKHPICLLCMIQLTHDCIQHPVVLSCVIQGRLYINVSWKDLSVNYPYKGSP